MFVSLCVFCRHALGALCRLKIARSEFDQTPVIFNIFLYVLGRRNQTQVWGQHYLQGSCVKNTQSMKTGRKRRANVKRGPINSCRFSGFRQIMEVLGYRVISQNSWEVYVNLTNWPHCSNNPEYISQFVLNIHKSVWKITVYRFMKLVLANQEGKTLLKGPDLMRQSHGN